jgi:ketosteroid isomerase-like protein
MRTAVRAANVIASFMMFSAVVLPAWSAGPTAEVKALHAADQAWLKGFTAADGDAMAKLYDEYAVLMPPNAPAVTGRDAIRAFLANMSSEAAKAGIVFSFGDKQDGGANGDLGWSSGTYTIKDKAGNVVETGKFLSVSKKVGGEWLYWRDTWNADRPPPQ